MGSLEGLWYNETHGSNLSYSYKVKEFIYTGRTRFQKVDILNLYAFGKTLFLDGKMQSAEIDERQYHEVLVHPSLISHPEPRKGVILGGGEGATLREALRHKTVEEISMVDIDEELVTLCRRYLPEWSNGAFDDSRARIKYEDARRYLEKNEERYDFIISDLTEPVEEGPSIMLFTKDFFELVSQRLEEDGIFVLQAGSTDPHYIDFFASLKKTLEKVFQIVRPFTTFIFSFQMLWAFLFASNRYDPISIEEDVIRERLGERGIGSLEFYDPQTHRILFQIPNHLRKSLQMEGRILTDEQPYVWET